MTDTVANTQQPSIPRRIAERLEALGFPVVALDPTGGAKPAGVCSWFERTLLASAEFRRSTAEGFAADRPYASPLPGVYLVPLPTAYDTEPSALTGPSVRHAVLVLGPELLDSEWLYRLCDHGQLDHAAVVARIDRTRLASPAEVERIALGLGWLREDADRLTRHRRELRSLSHELSHNYEELSLLYKLSCTMTLGQDADAFFREACEELHGVTGLRWLAVQIIDRQPRLEHLAGRVYTAGEVRADDAVARLGRDLIQRYGPRPEPVIFDRVDDLGPDAAALGTSLLVAPLVRDGQTLGVIFGGDRLDGQHIDSAHAKLCVSLGNSLTIFLENLMLFEDARSLFVGTLHALTAAIDAKDSYTLGHSERVALLCRMLAEAAGYDADTVERVYLAGLVHDVGKIGVPEAVLCKPGRLTDAEFDQIKKHPAIGATILRDIRQMDDLIPGVRYHHERWDGQGYPDGLAGMNIPDFGRLIGLADAFDAMSSDRTYRRAMSLDKALEEIRDNRGSQFDPGLADVFLGLDFAPYFELIQRHRAGHRNPPPVTPRDTPPDNPPDSAAEVGP